MNVKIALQKRKTASYIMLLAVEIVLLCICLYHLLQKQQTWTFDQSNLVITAGSFDEDGNYVIDESSGVTGATVLSTGPMNLSRGVYKVWLSFDTDAEQLSEVTDESLGYRGLLQNAVTLRVQEQQTETSYRFVLTQNTNDLEVTVYYTGTGTLKVSGLTVTHTNQEYSMILCLLFLFFILMDFLLFHRMFGTPWTITTRQVIFGIGLISFLASYPIMIDYMHLGDDVYFHMNRIEGLVREWQAGDFPARMQSFWLYGLGYPVSIMYGDVFLWISAFFRYCGFDLAFSFKIGLVIWNVITAIVCYFSFKGIFKSRYIGLFGSALYTLSLYRMYNIYVRLAIGEYTAMTFLPLACWGFAQILAKDQETVKQKKNVWILAIAYTGMLFSHVLTLVFGVFFGVVVCLIYVKRFFRKETIVATIKAVLLALGLSLWFLVPFLDYSLHMDMQVFHVERPIQKFGLYITQLFWVFPWMGYNPSMWETGMQSVRPFGIGLGLLLGTGTFIYLVVVKRADYIRNARNVKIGIVSLGIACFSCYMCLSIFPWDSISEISEGMKNIVYSIQFPYRLLLIVTLSMTIVSLTVATMIRGQRKKITGGTHLFTGCIVAATLLSTLFFTNHELQLRAWSDLRDAACMGADVLGGKEYLLEGTDMSQLDYTAESSGPNVTCSSYEKEDSTVIMHCSNTGNTDSYMEITLLNYKGYHAWNTDTGESMQIENGDQNLIRVVIPAGFQGNITVSFTGEWYWRVADAITLLTLLGMALYGVHQTRKSYREKNEIKASKHAEMEQL